MVLTLASSLQSLGLFYESCVCTPNGANIVQHPAAPLRVVHSIPKCHGTPSENHFSKARSFKKPWGVQGLPKNLFLIRNSEYRFVFFSVWASSWLKTRGHNSHKKNPDYGTSLFERNHCTQLMCPAHCCLPTSMHSMPFMLFTPAPAPLKLVGALPGSEYDTGSIKVHGTWEHDKFAFLVIPSLCTNFSSTSLERGLFLLCVMKHGASYQGLNK